MGERINWLLCKEFATAMIKTEAAARAAAKVLNK